MRVILVGRFQDLHAVDADPRPHCVLRSSQAEFGHAVQQHVVELAEEETVSIDQRYSSLGFCHWFLPKGPVLNTAGNLNCTEGRHSA